MAPTEFGLRRVRRSPTVFPMSPIEQSRVTQFTRQLSALGVHDVTITAISAATEDWSFRIAAGGREFVVRFNHRERLRAEETTPGAEKPFDVTEASPACTSAQAERLAARLLAASLRDPARTPREPPVL